MLPLFLLYVKKSSSWAIIGAIKHGGHGARRDKCRESCMQRGVQKSIK